MPKVAKLFANGRSQAVRLPREFRFEGSEVFIRKDPTSGDVVLSQKPSGWEEFFVLARSGAEEAKDFMLDR
ncbi:MAG: AbrB/MazE/SpoVT family DNA-binding domain-containing protein, partial [Caulobacteraceae bacterium]